MTYPKIELHPGDIITDAFDRPMYMLLEYATFVPLAASIVETLVSVYVFEVRKPILGSARIWDTWKIVRAGEVILQVKKDYQNQ